VHGRQPANEDEIADLAVTAERCEVAKITSLPTWQSCPTWLQFMK